MPRTVVLGIVLLCGLASGLSAPCTATAAEADLFPIPSGYTTARTEPHTLVDAGRDGREIPVMVRYPSDAVGPVPVIVWSHGGGPRPRAEFGNEVWGEVLAGGGYAVVHLVHLARPGDTRWACAQIGLDPCDGGEAHRYLRPGDAVAVLEGLDELIVARPELEAVLDLDRVIMAGHSYGAFTTLAVAGTPINIKGGAQGVVFGSDVPRGYLALSPSTGAEQHGFSVDAWQALDEPVLMASGAGDATPETAAEERDDAFLGMPSTGLGVLLWIEDPEAVHETFNLNDPDHPEMARWLVSTVFAWLAATLDSTPAAVAWMASDALATASGGVAELRRT